MNLKSHVSRFYASCAARLGLTQIRFTVYVLVAAFVFTTTLFVRSNSYRDPGSWFFDPDLAYLQQYSAIRLRQAEHFISAADDAPPFTKDPYGTAQVCVGIPSIARQGARYLRSTVGSLLAGLTQEERDEIDLVVFIPHTNPDVHPAYHEPWLKHLANDVLLYNLSKEGLDHVMELENDHGLHREKALFDYTYLMKACYDKGTPYIALIEDDVLALDGWYHRAVAGLQHANSKSALGDFLYMRLFYTEEFLGWNGENWLTHAFWSLAAIVGSALLVYWLRQRSPDAKRALTPGFSLVICGLVVPWAILLVFAAGRVTVFPLPQGINSMNNYGCCAQGLVFPRHKAHVLIGWYESQRIGFADMLTEQYADEHGEQRWALTPSVLQHIGAKSSKKDDYSNGAKNSKSVAENIWNFAFELNKPKALRKEHELAAIDPAFLVR